MSQRNHCDRILDTVEAFLDSHPDYEDGTAQAGCIGFGARVGGVLEARFVRATIDGRDYLVAAVPAEEMAG